MPRRISVPDYVIPNVPDEKWAYGGLEFTNDYSWAVAPANAGRIRYNRSLQRLEFSENASPWAQLVTSGAVAQTIRVAKSGGDFTSVAAAVNSIADATAAKPYVVEVFPGVYDEPPFSMKAYVSVVGQGDLYGVFLRTTNNLTHFINMVCASELARMVVKGPTGANCAAIHFSDTSDIPAIIDHVAIQAGYYGIYAHSATTGILHCLYVSNYYIGSVITEFIRVVNSSIVVGISCSPVSGPANSILTGYRVSGPDAELFLDLCSFTNAGNTDAVHVDDGCTIRMTACSFSEGLNAIHVGATGTGTSVYATGCVIREDFTYDVLVDTPLCSVAFQGVAERSKFSIPPGTQFVATFADRIDAEPGEVVIGELWLGNTPINEFPLGAYSRSTAATGLADGGEATEGAGLLVHVPAGVGYIRTNTGVTRVTWTTIDIPVTANVDRAWIIVDAAGVVQESLFRPDPELVISLCSYATDNASVVGISRYYNDLKQIQPKIAIYDRDVIGPISVSGGITTQNTDPGLDLAVTAATYYVYFTRQVTAGDAPVTFTYWHRAAFPGTGWVKTSGQTNIDTAQYDNNGTLTPIPGGKYKRDVLYVTSDGTNEEYHVVYGQQVFDNPPPSDALVNPTPPDFLNQAALRLAAVVVLSGAVDIQAIIDQRPMLGQNAAPTTGVTVHGSLLGLAANDHTQYQLRSEEGNPNGYCGLDAGGLVPAANLDLTFIPPVDISALVPDVGISVQIARADHQHAHAVQTDPTLHAIVVAGVSNGFMSAAMATQLAATVPNTRTVTAGAGLTGGGDLSADRTFDIIANADGSIVVNANDIQVGILATDAQHGNRGGDSLHAAVVAGVSNGFMTAAMATQLAATVPNTRTVTAGAGLTGGGDLSANRTFDIVANADGSIVVNANDIQVGTLATDAQHGNLGGGALHDAVVAGGASGFMTGAQATQLAATVPNTRTVTAGAGLTGGGDLSANRTLDIVANADGSIVVNANDIQVGTLATDGQHGNLGGGALHAVVVAGVSNGFMTAAMATQLAATVPNTRTVTAGAGLTGGGDLSANRTINVAANADGSITVNADDIQVGILATDAQHGNRGGGAIHSAVTGAANGFMIAADKTKLDSLAKNFIAEETVSRTQTTAADVLMGNQTLTPAAGTYLVTFTGNIAIGTNNRPTFMSIYSGGVQVAASEREFNTSNAGQTLDSFCCQAVVTVNGAQAIEGRWRTTVANTATSNKHTITALRVQ